VVADHPVLLLPLFFAVVGVHEPQPPVADGGRVGRGKVLEREELCRLLTN
jgi:hypothetical protein